MRRIDANVLPCFGIVEFQEANVWQHVLARITDGDRHDVVPPGRALHGFFIAGVQKVAEHEHQRAPVQHLVEKVKTGPQIRADLVRLMDEQIAYQPQSVARPFARRQVMLDIACQHEQRGLVIVADGAKDKQGCDFGHDVALVWLTCQGVRRESMMKTTVSSRSSM